MGPRLHELGQMMTMAADQWVLSVGDIYAQSRAVTTISPRRSCLSVCFITSGAQLELDQCWTQVTHTVCTNIPKPVADKGYQIVIKHTHSFAMVVYVIFRIWPDCKLPWQQSSWGQHGAQLGLTGPRWAPCWLHEPCYLGGDWFPSPH